MKRSYDWLFLLVSVLFCTQCVKTKESSTILPPAGLNQTNSSVRVFNLFGFNFDVSVNNIPLTPYGTASSGNVYSQQVFGGGYFKDGASFSVPYDLVAKDGAVHLLLTPNVNLVQGIPPKNLVTPIDTAVTNDPINPKDYYILGDGHFVALPRSLAVPVTPSNFKIRVVNYSSLTDPNQIMGPVTLTYADGSPVDPALSNIAPGTSSSYIELPFGAYEFKLYVASGNQISITQQLSLMDNTYTLPPDLNSTISNAGPKPNWNPQNGPGTPVFLQDKRFCFSKVYEPGGTYDLFVTPNVGVYTLASGGCCVFASLNSFHILTENSPPRNITYARLQVVNTLPVTGPVTFKVDGQSLGAPLAFGAHSDYGVFVQGTHVVEADDAKGTVLAQSDLNLFANDDISAWLYQNDTVAAFCYSANDMSRVNSNVLLQARFLNLTTNVSYATFLGQAQGNTAFTDANDTLGKPTLAYDPYYTNQPYYNWSLVPGENGSGAQQLPYYSSLSYLIPTGTVNQAGNPIMTYVPGPGVFTSIYAFSSSPGVVPGAYLADVPAIADTSFIANKALYSPNSSLPPAEPGVYTVALIGTEGDSTDAFYPRMIIVKHTK